MEDNGYIEVETPMLTPKATGAAAEPFETYHNALDIKLYARIAPELYLKRLMVGGFEKVYELNRNFRNEGLSHKHSPEFTMLEFYCAYMDVNGMMDFAEEMIRESVKKATGGLTIEYEGNEIDFEKPFERLPMKDAIIQNLPNHLNSVEGKNIDDEFFSNARNVLRLEETFSYLKSSHIHLTKEKLHSMSIFTPSAEFWESVDEHLKSAQEDQTTRFERYWKNDTDTLFDKDADFYEVNCYELVSKAIESLFELVAEERIIQPTFIIDYPKAISPLSKASPENPEIAERFELFISGAERANGFSELNSPKEQYERFVDQMKEREGGDKRSDGFRRRLHTCVGLRNATRCWNRNRN